MSLVLALILDALMGEPRALWARVPHPVVLMGRYITWLETILNQGSGKRLKGMFLLVILVGMGLLIGLTIQSLGRVGFVLEIVIAGILIAQRSLVEHIQAVVSGLNSGLEAGRSAVSRIVGRDSETLDEAGVARAAIESCAENFSDAVAAPVFWFAVAGLPGIIVYKFVNTADSMIGHRTERHGEIGWASARFDDLLNLIPARLCGLLICLVAQSLRAVRVMLRDAGLHNSPNAGWPEAALAAALGVAIAGPRVYDGKSVDSPYMNAEGRKDATAEDVQASIGVIWKAWGWLVAIAIVLAVLELT